MRACRRVIVLLLMIAATTVTIVGQSEPRTKRLGSALGSGEPGSMRALARPYARDIVRAANYHFGLGHGTLFVAQIYQESGFREKVVSNAGASGLGQFIPKTAKDMQRLYASKGLSEFCSSAAGCPTSPGWAINALVLLNRENFRSRQCSTKTSAEARCVGADIDRLAFMLADYNGGPGILTTEIDACRQTNGCKAAEYFGHVQEACGQGTKKRSSDNCKQNQEYPGRIIFLLKPVFDADPLWTGR